MEGTIGEIILFAGNFAPRNWAFCDGQLLSIQSNPSLFSIIGDYYGGDAQTTFALPDLRGRAPVHAGRGPGLSPRNLGQKFGSEQISLRIAELPSHHHFPQASNAAGNAQDPINNVNADEGNQTFSLFQTSSNGMMMQTTETGGNLPHDNMQPSLVMNYIICIAGIYPQRS